MEILVFHGRLEICFIRKITSYLTNNKNDMPSRNKSFLKAKITKR